LNESLEYSKLVLNILCTTCDVISYCAWICETV